MMRKEVTSWPHMLAVAIATLLLLIAFYSTKSLRAHYSQLNQQEKVEQQEHVESEIVIEVVTRGTEGLSYNSICTAYFPGGYYVGEANSTQVPDYTWFEGEFTHVQGEFTKEEADGLLIIDVEVDGEVKYTVETDEPYGSISFEYRIHSAPTKS